MSGKLTPKQQRFVEEYLIDGNGTAAYKRAGYQVKSDNTAAVNAKRLLRNAKVSAAVAKAQESRSERTEVSADWVVKHLKEEACDHGEGASHSARVRALEALGKTVGLFNQDVLKLLEQLIGSFDPGSADRIREGIRQEVSQGGPATGHDHR